MSPTSCQTAPPRNGGANYRQRSLRRTSGAAAAGVADPVDVLLLGFEREQVLVHLVFSHALLGHETGADLAIFFAIHRQRAPLLGVEARWRLEFLLTRFRVCGLRRGVRLGRGLLRGSLRVGNRGVLRERELHGQSERKGDQQSGHFTTPCIQAVPGTRRRDYWLRHTSPT